MFSNEQLTERKLSTITFILNIVVKRKRYWWYLYNNVIKIKYSTPTTIIYCNVAASSIS